MGILGQRGVLAAAVLTAASIAVPGTAREVHAYAAVCRSDPAVVLSNGAVLDLSASIGTSTSQVHQISYALHGPAGTFVVAVVPTDGLLGLDERFSYTPDQSAGAYESVTDVSTSAPAAVTATALVTSLPTLGMRSAAGFNNQDLVIRLAP